MILVSDDVTGGGMRYGCDELKRVTSANINQGRQTFTYNYDQYGNRWSQVGNGGITMNLQFNAKNQVIANNYDAAGNVLWDGLHNYTYDAEGNVLTVDGGSTATYTYNALNQRVRSAQGSGVQEYVYNLAGQRVSTWNGTNHAQLEGKHYWGAKPVAFYSGGALHFEHQDWLGTERLRTTYSGATEGVYTSGVWGDGYSVVGNGSDLDPAHFASLDHDGGSNTDHATFRQYSAGQGHWLSPDPYDGSYDFGNPQSLNRYGYVLGNPVAGTDPSGLCGGDDPNVAGFHAYSSCACDHGDCPPVKPPPSPPPPSPCFFSCPGQPPPGNPPTNPGGPPYGGGPGAGKPPGKPTPPKSPARQACEDKAQQKYANAQNQASYTAAKGFVLGAGVTAGVQFSAGCVVGTYGGAALGGLLTLIIGGEGFFAGAPVGCFTVGVSTVMDGLPQSGIAGGITAVAGYKADVSSATTALNKDLQDCAKIP